MMNLGSRSDHEACPLVMSASVHALGWLTMGNLAGLVLAVLLASPKLGTLLGEWSYGRWMPVHLNIHLYGWLSLPLIAMLLYAYRVRESGVEVYARPVVWLWSLALAIGCAVWLAGGSSGKIFLDWGGMSGMFFISVLTVLWLLLAVVSWQRRNQAGNWYRWLGLVALLPVPVMLFMAMRPEVYPPVNPDTGGPTGSSLLGSSLSIVVMLLLLPLLCRHQARYPAMRRWGTACVVFLIIEVAVFMLMGHGNSSHRDWPQYVGLGSLMLWIPLIAGYFSSWHWPHGAGLWRSATLVWLAVLILSGWLSFLPGWLDQLKFTHGLVAHSHLAMAGFCSSFLMLLMVGLLPVPVLSAISGTLEFVLWQIAVAGYVLLMGYCGWREVESPGFVMNPGPELKAIYVLRLLCGLVMAAVSLRWWKMLVGRCNAS